jgi:hypothetical protein
VRNTGRISSLLEDRTPTRIIYVPGKILNLVIPK